MKLPKHKLFTNTTIAALAFFCLLSSSQAHSGSHSSDHHHHHEHKEMASLCGMEEPSVIELLTDRVRTEAFRESARRRRLIAESCEDLCDQCIEVPINLHLMMIPLLLGSIVPHPTPIYEEWTRGGPVSVDNFSSPEYIEQLFLENLVVLNRAFEGTPFRFSLKRVTRTSRLDWNREVIDAFREMSNSLGTDDPTELDVFLSLQLTKGDRLYIGMASNAAAQEWRNGDGVYMRYDALTDGGLSGSDKGYILVHEVGHWMGLWHTFQEPLGGFSPGQDVCDASLRFDDIDDTPAHIGPTPLEFDCRDYLDAADEDLPDSCPNLPGVDPIFNYLNYVEDEECWEERGEFTCQQIERMYLHYKLYREFVTTCEDNEMEIEISLTVGDDYIENSIVLTDEDSNVYFSSKRDHALAAHEYGSTSLLVDLCVSSEKEYTLLITDTAGNGFGESSALSIYIDRQLVHAVEGDFGVVKSLRLRKGMSALVSEKKEVSKNTTSDGNLGKYAKDLPSAIPSNAPVPYQTTSPTVLNSEGGRPPVRRRYEHRRPGA